MDGWRMERFTLDERDCWAYLPGGDVSGLPVVYMLAGDEFAADLPELFTHLTPSFEKNAMRQFAIVGFGPADWNRDYTPWPAPPLKKGGAAFTGGGKATLDFLVDSLKPEVCRRFGTSAETGDSALVGYSLGGLMALWAMYESDAFGRCGCCSGSLWYDGWVEYAGQRSPRPGSQVYMSLGVSEERARNPRMARVGDATRQTASLLSSPPNTARCTLELNEGGHFADVTRRIARAIAWLMDLGGSVEHAHPPMV